MSSPSPSPPTAPSTDERYVHHFRWDSSVPESVSIKGSFDNWKSALQLQKHPSGKFSAPIELTFGSRVTYKYVVDGTWRHNPKEPTETDSNGNINNVFQVPHPQSTTADPAPDSVQPGPNPATTMSSGALSEEPSKKSTVKDIPTDSETQIADTSSADMSIAFPSTSTDQVPELIQRPKQPRGTKRTTSLFSAATRFARPSYRAASLISSAPGTPAEKASPAGASVSNVVSALAGMAATAIPAAIFAVTGKDITRSPTKPPEEEATQGHDSAETSATSQTPDENSPTTSPTDASLTQEGSTRRPIQSTDLITESSQTLPQFTPLPLSQASQNSQPKDGALVDASTAHQLLPETSIPPHAESISTTANTESAQTANTALNEPLPLTETPAATIVLTPPSAASIVPNFPSTTPEPHPLESNPVKPEQSIEQPESPIEQPEPSIKQPEPSIKQPEPSIKQPEPSIKQPESSIKQPESSIKQPEPSIKRTEPSTQHAEETIQHPEQLTEPRHPPTGQSERSNEQPIPVSTEDVRGETKLSASNENINTETPARVSFTEERPTAARKASVTPKRGSTSTSKPVSPSLDDHINATITSPAPKNEQTSSLGTKPKKNGTLRKTSGWRYSVGSIRSRRMSGENHGPSDDHPQDPNSNADDGSSPRGKRRSGIFQKIKSALSPNKHQNKSPTIAKRNSFARTTTINQS